MKKSYKKILIAAALIGGLAFVTSVAQASELGHFAPGVASIRDYVVPDPGFYGIVYNYWYSSNRLNDHNGNKVDSVTVGAKPGIRLDVDLKVNVYAVSPVFTWVSNWKVLGAKYAAFVTPSFSNSSIGVSLTSASGQGLSSNTSQFGVGDLFVSPLWLGWSLKNWDFALGYGFYVPVGKFNIETVTLPGGASLKAESADNIGLGFWTHQIQGGGSWYPWADKRMAVSGVLTYEINQNKKDFDLTPGQVLTLNWGISQFLPLKKDQTLMLEGGLAGYNCWQITDDTGKDARNPEVHDQVHAIGLQLGLTYVPWVLSVNLRGFYEYAAQDRFQGATFGLNIAKKF